MHLEKVMKVHNLLVSAGSSNVDVSSVRSKKAMDLAMKRISKEVSVLRDNLVQSGAVSEDVFKDIDGMIAEGDRDRWRDGLRNFLQKKILGGCDAEYLANLPTKIAFLVVGGCANFVL